jgi:hypothetical protein
MTTEKIFIGIDDQVIEAKGEVLQALLAEIADNKAKEAAAEAAIAAKETAKAALLERLGITAEEAALLLG